MSNHGIAQLFADFELFVSSEDWNYKILNIVTSFSLEFNNFFSIWLMINLFCGPESYLQALQTSFWFPHLSCVLSVKHHCVPIDTFLKFKVVGTSVVAKMSSQVWCQPFPEIIHMVQYTGLYWRVGVCSLNDFLKIWNMLHNNSKLPLTFSVFQQSNLIFQNNLSEIL